MNLSIEKQNYLLDLYLYTPEYLKNNVQLPITAIEQTEFLQLAAHNKVGANLYLQLKRLDYKGNDFLLRALEETYLKVKAKNVQRLKVGIPILVKLKKQGIEVIVLKGNAIAEDIFFDIGYKPMNDIDILVKREDLSAIFEIFQKEHLITAAPLEADFRKQEKYSHHWPPFFDKKLDVFLGTHWDIAAPTRGLKIPIQDFWNCKEEFMLMGETFYRLSPKHFILHLCVHLNSAKTGLREIGDLVAMIEVNENKLDVAEFIQMTTKSHTEKEVFEALSLATALRSFKSIEEILTTLNRLIVDEDFKAMVKKRSSPRHKLLHIRTNYISKIEKTFALFMLTEAPLEKTLLLAKMWRIYLLVPGPEALRLDYEFPEASFLKKILSSLLAPLKISQVFIKDMGFSIFMIVTLRHQWVLLRSYGNYIIKKIKGEPIQSLDSIAKGLGLTFKEIKEISALD